MQYDLGKARLVYKGVYSASIQYEYLDWITLNGSSYVNNSETSITGINPESDGQTAWIPLAKAGGTSFIRILNYIPSPTDLSNNEVAFVFEGS